MKSIDSLFKGSAIIVFALVSMSFVGFVKPDFHKRLNNYCKTLPSEFDQISEERKKSLEEIGDFVIEKRSSHKTASLLFICTSNSRRSHFAQIWSQTAASYYGVDSTWTFSGGTEATAVNINAIKALERSGFSISSADQNTNPIWLISPGKTLGSWVAFSKKYNDPINPKKDFSAIMVCSEADRSCPIVDGSDIRVSLAYEDPKYFDNTPAQDQKYDERCRQIAREMFYMMDYVKQKMILKEEVRK